MFKKKIPKYLIRKLTVGAASVLIGMAFLNSNEAKADTVTKIKQSQSQLNRLKILLRIQKKTLIKLRLNISTTTPVKLFTN